MRTEKEKLQDRLDNLNKRSQIAWDWYRRLIKEREEVESLLAQQTKLF